MWLDGSSSRTFCETHDEQINLVDDFSWYEPEKLKNVSDEIYQILAENPYRNFENSDQPEKELNALLKRVEKLNMIATGKK
jgi:predicted DCC family thiol-disulfide oxidoreductase YuxK